MQQLIQIVSTVWKTYSEMLKSNPVIGGAVTLYGMGVFTYVFKSIPARILAYVKSQFTVGVAIHNENQLFSQTTQWLEKGNRVFRCKSFIATVYIGKEKSTVSISVGNGNHIFFWGGRPFWLTRVEKEVNNTTERKESLFISTIGWYPDSIKKFLQNVVARNENKEETSIYNFYESFWSGVTSKPTRKLESVVMTNENERKLKEHITQYMASKQWYKEHKIPWRTGIVLEGPPGTGKSTLSLALCGEFDCNLFIANLSMMSDEKIVSMFKCLPPRSIILIEDIDSYSLTRSRDKGKKDSPAALVQPAEAIVSRLKRLNEPEASVMEELSLFSSLSGLLNAIDGICSTEDRILIATTNHIERLDPALIRPGRFELILKIDNLDDETVRKMFKKFYPDFALDPNFKIKPDISPVQFQTMAIGNKTNPQALVDFCRDGEKNV